MVAPARDVLTGGAGADKFVFDSAAYADATAATPIVDHITDYDRGNTGTYSLLEGDQLDLTALLSTAYGSGQAANALVRVVENVDGTGAFLQVDLTVLALAHTGRLSDSSMACILDRPSTLS